MSQGMQEFAMFLGKALRFWIFGGKWLIIIGILIVLGIYIRKKNREK